MARRAGVDCDAKERTGGEVPRGGSVRREDHLLRAEGFGAAETAVRIQAETGAVLIHPYDDDRIIAGQATAAKELLEEVTELDAVLAPVSGGGLLSGTCLGAKGMRATVRVLGCEPERADDAYRSLQTGVLQTQETSDTIADGLRASLAPRTFAILRKYVDGILLVSEEEIRTAMRLVWQRMKIVIEPSSAVALAPCCAKAGWRLWACQPARMEGRRESV